MPKLRQVDLSELTLPQIELGLKVVSRSLVLEKDPSTLTPPELSHLSEMQWENLFWAHAHLMHQREHSLLH
jgi:hypothetical protein